MIIVGIDPGANGSLAVISGYQQVKLISFTGKSPQELWELFGGICNVKAYLEKVHSMPTDGKKQAFSFGRNVGLIEMALTATRFPFEYVQPKAWQKELGLSQKYATTPLRKRAHKERAQQLFPLVSGITQSNADGLLIAEYGYRRNLGV